MIDFLSRRTNFHSNRFSRPDLIEVLFAMNLQVSTKFRINFLILTFWVRVAKRSQGLRAFLKEDLQSLGPIVLA